MRARGRRAVPLNGPRRLPRAPRPPRCGPVLGAAGESPCEPERRAAGALPAAGRTGPAPAGTPTSRRPRAPPPHFPRTPRRALPRLPQCPSSRRAPPAEVAGGARAWGGARPAGPHPAPPHTDPGSRRRRRRASRGARDSRPPPAGRTEPSPPGWGGPRGIGRGPRPRGHAPPSGPGSEAGARLRISLALRLSFLALPVPPPGPFVGVPAPCPPSCTPSLGRVWGPAALGGGCHLSSAALSLRSWGLGARAPSPGSSR